MTRSYGLIHIQSPDGESVTFLIEQEVTAIGCSPDNQLVLEHDSISSEHARLRCEEGKFYMEDLDSSQGTYIDEHRLPVHQPILLAAGQEVRLGAVILNIEPIPVAEPPQKRRTDSLAMIALAAGGALLIICCISAVFLFWRLRAPKAIPEAVCDQPEMTVLRVGGRFLQPGAGVVTVSPEIPEPPTSESLFTESPTTEPLIVETLIIEPPGTEPISATATAEIAPQGPVENVQPLPNTAFLELPFPYDGGNENFGGTTEQFRLASLIYHQGGRVNSYFDHLLPLYPPEYNGKEPEQYSGGLLIFDGSLRSDVFYSGHPGYDFKTYEYRQPTTPLLAAADGVIHSVGEHGASGALFVRIVHTVEGVGDFRTTYWHLHPDEWYEAMLGRTGQPITAGTRVGTMGNTGYSTGHHLHFEVRFDRNGDGYFGEGERVDPYGYIPSDQYPQDPWVENGGVDSPYLWIHPLGMVAEVPPSGGGSLMDPDGAGGEIGLKAAQKSISGLCAKENSLPPGGRVYWSWALDPPPSPELQGIGKTVVIRVVDSKGTPVSDFSAPLDVIIPFDDADLGCIDPDSLRIYWVDLLMGVPQRLETRLNLRAGVARASAIRPGKFTLMGRPTCDTIPPRTEIRVSGQQSSDGTWYQEVMVSMESSDPSGIERIDYSLDGGSTWQQYQGPFTLEPSGIPSPDYVMDAQFFGLGPGRNLVIAAAVDGAGNIEDPPTFLGILIDPSKDPNLLTRTPTRTPTFTPTPTNTLTATPTAIDESSACATEAYINISANCRLGPGPDYPVLKPLPADITLDLLGQNLDPNVKWWQVALPDSSESCWVSGNLVSVEGDTSPECVLEVEVAPPPTPTFTPSPEPSPNQPPPAPTGLFPPPPVYKFDCTSSVNLSWSPVDDKDGIKYYEWKVQRSSGDNTGPFSAYASGQTTATRINLKVDCNTWYRWRVRAVDGAGLVGPYTEWHLFFVKMP